MSNPGSLRGKILDCVAEPVIGPRFARTRWLAMTVVGRVAQRQGGLTRDVPPRYRRFLLSPTLFIKILPATLV
ncbi:protein of unknown function [Bradyrhizobium vignae]|uniref:Uncharacterized protein n=1 Tax=Bradyrhizobium vignae TaxID=1549949 RepID=A0A2U3PRJ9_9BRAD|nr:protein of unknown function [Bradyrhizobium vignae]